MVLKMIVKKVSPPLFTAAIVFCFLATEGIADENRSTGNAGFLYVTNFSSDNIVGYKLFADGTASPIEGSPFPAGKGPVAIIRHPSGKFAYVANSRSHNIMGYNIDRSGGLRLVAGSPFPAGTAP